MTDLSRRFPLLHQKILLGGQFFEFVTTADQDALLDALIQKGDEHPDVQDERLPYWAELWPSALALAGELLEGPSLAGKTSLELGAGLAIPSIAAARRDAEATATDYLPDALDFARYNAQRNGVTLRVERLDWRDTTAFEPVDVLLASDVAYEERDFEPLTAAFSHLLKADGRLLLTEPRRPHTRPFLEKLPQAGFHVERRSRFVNYQGRRVEIYVFELRK